MHENILLIFIYLFFTLYTFIPYYEKHEVQKQEERHVIFAPYFQQPLFTV